MEFSNLPDSLINCQPIPLDETSDLFVISPDLLKEEEDNTNFYQDSQQLVNSSVEEVKLLSVDDNTVTKRLRKPSAKFRGDFETAPVKRKPLKRRVRKLPAKNTPEHFELRRRNNEAVRKSRLHKKRKELEKEIIIERQKDHINDLESIIRESEQEKAATDRRLNHVNLLLSLIEGELRDIIPRNHILSLVFGCLRDIVKQN